MRLIWGKAKMMPIANAEKYRTDEKEAQEKEHASQQVSPFLRDIRDRHIANASDQEDTDCYKGINKTANHER